MQTEKQETHMRKMTDEEGRDMGESMRRLFGKAPKRIDGLADTPGEPNGDLTIVALNGEKHVVPAADREQFGKDVLARFSDKK